MVIIAYSTAPAVKSDSSSFLRRGEPRLWRWRRFLRSVQRTRAHPQRM